MVSLTITKRVVPRKVTGGLKGGREEGAGGMEGGREGRDGHEMLTSNSSTRARWLRVRSLEGEKSDDVAVFRTFL